MPHQQAGVVGPLEVLQHQHDRPVLAQLVDEADDPVDQADQPVDGHQHRVLLLPRVRGLGGVPRQPGGELGPARVGRPRVDAEARQHQAEWKAPSHFVPGLPEHFAAPVDGVGEARGDQAGLADPRLALDPHRRALAVHQLDERAAQRGQLGLPADEHLRVRRDRRPRHHVGLAARALAGGADLVVHLAQLRARLDAELVDQDLPGLPEHLQRLVRAAGAVQRLHEQRPRRLAQRVGGAQVEQLVDGLGEVAGLQHDLRAPFQDVQVQLREPAPVQRGERPVDAGERLAPPQHERRVQRGPRARRVPAVPALLRGLAQPVELAHVQQAGFQPQAVAGPGGHQHLTAGPLGTDGFERAPQPGDVGVEAAVDGAGRRLAPDGVDQLLAGHHLVRAHGEHGEQGALPGRAERQLRVPAPGADRAQQLDPQRFGQLRRHTAPLPFTTRTPARAQLVPTAHFTALCGENSALKRQHR